MKKKIQKAFDAEAAKNGAKVETRDGMPARIICYDREGGLYPIIALVDNDGYEICNGYDHDGKVFCSGPGEHDLVIIEEIEVPEFNVGDWVVMKDGGDFHDGRKFAKIVNVDDEGRYWLDCGTWLRPNEIRHWTIKDAKPGDVLVDVLDHPFIYKRTGVVHFPKFPVAYCGITEEGDFRVDGDDDYWTINVKPATKEQMDWLFSEIEKDGYEWDAKSLTLSKIQKIWRNDKNAKVKGYIIDVQSQTVYYSGYNNTDYNYNVFATKDLAKAAIAMARISQIMANDKRFGGPITDKEWENRSICKYALVRIENNIRTDTLCNSYNLLSFHTREQRALFLKENEDIVKDYLMLK